MARQGELGLAKASVRKCYSSLLEGWLFLGPQQDQSVGTDAVSARLSGGSVCQGTAGWLTE